MRVSDSITVNIAESRGRKCPAKRSKRSMKDRKRKHAESTPEFPSTPGQLEIPTTPTSYSNMVKNLVDKITPRRQNVLRRVGIWPIYEWEALEAMISGVDKLTSSNKGKRSKDALKLHKQISYTLFSKYHQSQLRILNLSKRANILWKYFKSVWTIQGLPFSRYHQKGTQALLWSKSINTTTRKTLFWKAPHVNVSLTGVYLLCQRKYRYQSFLGQICDITTKKHRPFNKEAPP